MPMHAGLQVSGGTLLAASEQRAGRTWGAPVLVMNGAAAGIAFASDFVAQVAVEGRRLRLCRPKKRDQTSSLTEGAAEGEPEEYRCTAARLIPNGTPTED